MDFVSLIYPRCCVSCRKTLNKSEDFLCLFCFDDLPVAHFINLKENPVEKVFEGRVRIKSAASWLHFKKGNKSQAVLHELKYRNNPELGVYLGKLIGQELVENPRFSGVDAMVPIPLHPSKLKKRGYNQSSCIAMGIAHILDVEVFEEMVIKVKEGTSQTRKNRLQRWENVAENFSVNKIPEVKIRHLLVVDDVITTGATLESFIAKINSVLNVDISVISLAYTD